MIKMYLEWLAFGWRQYFTTVINHYTLLMKLLNNISKLAEAEGKVTVVCLNFPTV